MKKHEISIIVKPDELNHHNTLFVGKALTYLVETGFITVSFEHGNPNELVCYGLNDFKFLTPVPNGSILTYEGQIVRVTDTTITTFVEGICRLTGTKHMSGWVTYVVIDLETRAKKHHNIVLDDTDNKEELDIRRKTGEFFAKIL